MNYMHDPDCTGWEDCHCFHVEISRERYASLLECASASRAAARWMGATVAGCDEAHRAYARLIAAIARLDASK
jgi:hypothetical protein